MRGIRRSAFFNAVLSGALATPLMLSIAPDALPKAPVRGPAPTFGSAVSGVQPLTPKKVTPPTQPANYAPTATRWPTAASGTMSLAPSTSSNSATSGTANTSTGNPAGAVGKVARASGTPLWGQALPDAQGSYTGPRSLTVRVLDHAAAQAVGVSGVIAQVSPVGPGHGAVRIGMDYSSFAQAYGGDYAARLRLVTLPACALTTPKVAACRVQTPLPSADDGAAQTLSASLILGTGTGTGTDTGKAGPAVVVAATSSSSGGDGGGAGGQYGATSLKPAGSWSAGGSSGAFDYSYAMPVPQAASVLAPSVGLSYDSGGVDGQVASTQAQSSWIGDGWTLADSFIEQSFTSCAGQPEGVTLPASEQTGDMCYDGPILTMSLNGSTSSLVWDSAKQVWKPSADDGEVVTHHTGTGNGAGTYNTDDWTVTTRDGTVYSFGLNRLPGWTSGAPTTNSVDTVPVYSANSGDPCYSSAGFSASVCTMAYRWHLDYVKDLHGDAMAYYYKQDTNYYGEDLGAQTTSYVRDSHLDHIDYGFIDGGAYGTVPDKVTFTTGDRCVSGACDPLNSTNAANWPDVPYDLVCPSTGTCANSGPSFFSTVRLTSVATQQYNGSGYSTVDTWKLSQTIPTTGTYNTSTLWLSSITHTGSDTTTGGSPVTLPPVTFSPIMMANRVNFTTGAGSGLGPLNRYRIGSVTTETGSVISVSYELVDPCPVPVTQTPSTNTSSCYPVYWTPLGASAPYLDWFNKYSVHWVSQSDPTGGSPGLYSQYTYLGHAAWHYDDNELVQPKYRTYGQFRGYGDVQTRTGQGTDPVTLSECWYYRGMDGDYLSPTSARSVTLTDSQGGKHADANELAGQTLESATYAYDGAPAPDSSTITSYWISAPSATRIRAGLPAVTANAVKPAETWSRQALTDTGTTTWRETESDTSYDANPADTFFGLPLFVSDTGDLSLLGTPASQATCVQTTYAPANTALNLVGLTAQTETDDQPCGGTSPGASSAPTAAHLNALSAPASLNKATDVVAATRTVYDDNTDAATWPQPASISQTVPTLGMPSITQAATGYANGAFTFQTKSATVYDRYGRPSAVYDALGDKTTSGYTMTGYGTVTGTTTTNALGQTQSTTVDPEHSIVTSATDADGVTTTVHYDGLGRTTAVWYHGRSTASPADVLYTYAISNSAATAVTTQTLNDESGYSASTQIYDALLRPRQSQTQALTVAAGRIVSDTFYDSHGWVTKTNNDYWDTSSNPGTTLVSVADNQVHRQTLTSYDGLGRAVETQSLDNASDPTVDTIGYTQYTGDKTITLPPAGAVATATVTDALGRTVELDQYTVKPTLTTGKAGGFTTVNLSGGTVQATKYTFDAHGRPYQTIDPVGEVWSTAYDYLGQPSSTTGPDTGATGATLYDALGRVIQIEDAAGHTTSYTYDSLGRKTGEYDAPYASRSSSNQLASWVYDNSNGVTGVTDAVGQLTTSTSYTSAGTFTVQAKGFNAFGESLGETYTVPGTSALAGNYTYQHSYTAVTGKPSGTLIPAAGGLSQEVLALGYSRYNGIDVPSTLSGLHGYTQNIAYTALGQIAQETIGPNNNASITNTYDQHTGAILDSRLVNTAVSATPLDEAGYSYDPAGNPTSQSDTRGGTASETQCYTYDTLDRLTGAWTTAGVGGSSCAARPTSGNAASTVGDGIPGAAYWTTWQFDALGQPTKQTQHALTNGGTDTTVGYTYGGSASSCAASSTGAHTLSGTSTTGPSGTTPAAYCNNNLGETTGRPDPSGTGQQTLAWDDEGRLATVTGSAGTTAYVYDASGGVVERTDPGTVTLFLPGQQLQLNTAVNTAAATRFIPLPGGGQVVESKATGDYRFELADPHGTATISLDANVQNPSWQQYTPYGAPRGGAPAAWNDPNGYLGQPQDTDVGLTTLGAREYDPELGRFLSVDPVFAADNPQTANGYTYAAANPVTHSDPSGKMVDCGSFGACGDPGGCNLTTHCGADTQNPPSTTDSGSSPSSSSGSSSSDSCTGLHGKFAAMCHETSQEDNEVCDAACQEITQAAQECSAKGGHLDGTSCVAPARHKSTNWWEIAGFAAIVVLAVVVVVAVCILAPEAIPALAEAGAEFGPELVEGAADVAADAAADATATAVETGADAAEATEAAAETSAEAASEGAGEGASSVSEGAGEGSGAGSAQSAETGTAAGEGAGGTSVAPTLGAVPTERVASAVIGGVTSGVANGGSQAKDGGHVDWWLVGSAVAIGAASGFAGAAVPTGSVVGSIGGNAAIGLTGGVLNNFESQLASGKKYDRLQTACAATEGALFGAVGGAGASGLNKAGYSDEEQAWGGAGLSAIPTGATAYGDPANLC